MIYIVRHGETDANQTNVLRGSYFDDELNEKGHEQVKEIAEQLKDIHFDVCYCSPLKRTLQTCEPIFKGEIILEKRLLPRDYGELIKLGETSKYLENHGYWNRELDRPVKDGESVSQVINRVGGFLDEISEKHQNQNVLVVTHGSIMAVMQAVRDNFSIGEECRSYKVENCGIVKIPNE